MKTLPTIVVGYIQGPTRWEALGARGELYFDSRHFYFMEPPRDSGWGWGITHIQKRSKWGFLLAWPFCFHIWIMPRLQEPGKPGTEKGWSARTPGKVWRASLFGFEWTWGRLAMRWD